MTDDAVARRRGQVGGEAVLDLMVPEDNLSDEQ
jgi:hypothetical protein